MSKVQCGAIPPLPRQGVKVIASQTLAGKKPGFGFDSTMLCPHTGNVGRVQASNRTTLGRGCLSYELSWNYRLSRHAT
jgi:hypothetical protein